MDARVRQISEKYNDKVVAWRRDFHKYAELGWREFRTTSKIVEILKKQGVPVQYGLDVVNPDYAWSYPKDEIDAAMERAVSQGADEELVRAMKRYTGAVATIDSGKPGPVIALRFDIDALGVKEARTKDHAPYVGGYSSVNDGVMHACGHDGHAAMGLAVSLILHELRDQLKGKVKVVFQPGEEGALGGQAISESGVLDDVDILYSGHLGMGVPTHTIVKYSEGYLASTKFDLTFEGCSAHAGAYPQNGRNAILAASSAILAMYSFCQDSRGATRVNAGKIVGGTGRNVIADRAVVLMETRGASNEIEERLHTSCLEAAKHAAAMYGCTAKAETKGYAASVTCDRDLDDCLNAALSSVEEVTEISPLLTVSASEDVGYLMKKVREHGGKASFMEIGADIAAPHHNEKFDFDEAGLMIGVKAYVAIVLETMRRKEKLHAAE
ncbi:MAG: amidohydrolase [Pyramidobacter sp.]